MILQSTDRLVDLVNDLLDVARLEAGKMEVHPRLFDVSEVVHEVATLMAPRLAEKEQSLDVRVPPGLPRAVADPGRVRQIVTNLLSNAHLYTDPGGRLEVSVQASDGYLELADLGQRPRDDPGRGGARLRPLRAPRGRQRAAPGSACRSSSRWWTCSAGRSTSRARRASAATFVVRLPAEAEAGSRVGPARGDPRQARAGGRRRAGHRPADRRAARSRSASRPRSVHSGDEALERLRERPASTR